MIANTNSTPVSSKKIDWIEELYYSETAEKLMTELSDVPDEVGETIPQICKITFHDLISQFTRSNPFDKIFKNSDFHFQEDQL